MKHKKDILEIDMVIYPFSLIIFFRQEFNIINKILKERIDDKYYSDIELLNEDFDAKTVSFPSGHTVISFIKLDRGLIAHEVFHAVSYIFNHINIPFSDDTQEAYAYLIQYITQQIDDNIE